MKTLYLLLLACTLHVVVFATQNYYVNKAIGSDANSGTITDPFATIQHAADSATAGDTVFIASGSYDERVVCATNSGLATSPIVFTPFDSAIVSITSNNDTVGNNGAALWTLQDVDNIVVNGLYFNDHRGHGVKGIWIEGGCNHITISNCNFRDIYCVTGNTDTTDIYDAYPILVQGTVFSKSISNLVLKGNFMSDCGVGLGSGIRLEGNVELFLITGNALLGVGGSCVGALGFKGVCGSPSKDQPRNGIIRYNALYGQKILENQISTVYLDGCKDMTVERNRILQAHHALNITCEAHGKASRNIIIRSNYLVRASVSGLKIGKSDTTTGFGKVKNCVVYGNSFNANGGDTTDGGEINVEFVDELKVHSNIFYTEPDKRAVFRIQAGSSIDFHHNLYYNPPTPAVPKSYSWLSTSYTTLAAYQAATGQDVGSQFADPLFEANWGDMHLKAGSPAINTGSPNYPSDVTERDIDSLIRVTSIIDCGAHETDVVTAIPTVSKISSYILSPNPATTYLTLTHTAIPTEEMVVLEIIDMTGKLHWTGKANTRGTVTEIESTHLTPGAYILSIWNGMSYEGLKFIKL